MTCYEILTGGIPFEGVGYSNYDVILSGKRPELPSDLNPKMKDLINRCWHQDPEARPTFNEIVTELKGLRREFITGSPIVSKSIDDVFHNAKSCRDIAGASPEANLVELKELIQALRVKYNQAAFLVLGCEIAADMEQFHSQFGFRSFEQRLLPSYTEWHARCVLFDSLEWRRNVLLRIKPHIVEVNQIMTLMGTVFEAMAETIESDEPYYADERSPTEEENAARMAELCAWLAEREIRVLPDEPHSACLEQMYKMSNDDGFQACDLCKTLLSDSPAPGEYPESCLNVDNSSLFTKLPTLIFSSFRRIFLYLF